MYIRPLSVTNPILRLVSTVCRLRRSYQPMDRGGRHRSLGGYSTPRGGRGRRSPRPAVHSAADLPSPVQADAYSYERTGFSRDGKSHGMRQTSSHGEVRTSTEGQSTCHVDNGSPSVNQMPSPDFGHSRCVGQSSVHVLQGNTSVDSEKVIATQAPDEAWPPLDGSHGGRSQLRQSMQNTWGDIVKQSKRSSYVPLEQLSSSFSPQSYVSNKDSGTKGSQSEKGNADVGSRDIGMPYMKGISHLQDENHSLADFTANRGSYTSDHERAQIKDEKANKDGSSTSLTAACRFDICPPPKAGSHTVILKPSLLEKNREKRNVMKQSMEGPKGTVLRVGMVLLKKYISTAEQVKIVKTCHKLGMGPGGFYQPGYRDGAKLHLHMMCLGKNWDPETRKYGDLNPIDGVKPPSIPDDFFQWVRKAINYSHDVIKEKSGDKNAKNTLPDMSPDICLVNFYSASGRLGLHQDRDESTESLVKGLPVVSFSIGDSAEFLFGDQRDIDKADKVVLDSGDVVIFGGKSRHIFHGVTRIIPNTAPKMVVDETNMRPGRLNLTFRQY
ncbi:hypothetical protein Dimus_027438 [Dionaea muscipula]